MNPYAFLWGAEGSAECRLTGAVPAAFLNRCALAHLRLDAVEPLSDTEMRVVLPLRRLQRARRIALRCQCELTPLHTRGAGVLARTLARRWVPVLGLLIAFALLAWSKFFIWEIDVTGNQTVSAAAVRGALNACGVGIGTFWPDLTSDNLRSELLVRMPELAWATVNIYGSRAEVIVRERVPVPPLLDADAPVDLVAERAGFVTEVRALNGTANVRPGSAVLPGEVLIAGRMDSVRSGSRETHAIGSVTAETYYELRAVAPPSETLRGEIRRVHRRWALLIGKKRVNFYRNSSFCPPDCDKINSVWECKIEGLFSLPLALLRETYAETERTEQPRDRTVLRREMEQQLHAQLCAAIGGGTIEQETYSCSEAGGRFVVCLRARCSEDIAKEQRK